MSVHVMVRFGRWQEIIDAPLPDDPELYPVSTAMCHYASGVAHASLKQFRDADRERQLFHDSLRRIPSHRRVFNNTARSILAVGEKMLDGELEYHKGNHEAGYAHLREAVDRDDNLEYIEPWAWMHPPRHALAALLAEQGHYVEAEQVCRGRFGPERPDSTVRPAPGQCLGAARPGGMSPAARRGRGTGRRAGKARIRDGACGRADHVFLHVSSHGRRAGRLLPARGWRRLTAITTRTRVINTRGKTA